MDGRSGTTKVSWRLVRGVIRRRLLVNAVVDPDEAAQRLPRGVLPHVIDGGTVVGCCLLELEQMRPTWAPTAVGVDMRAAAHRISVEWGDPDSGTTAGVFVPVRHTDSRLASLAGGRAFPGVHHRATIELDEGPDLLRWDVDARDGAFGIRVEVSPLGEPADAVSSVGSACIDATVGLSPGLSGMLEAVSMLPAHKRARLVTINDLDSTYISSFESAEMAPSYLMADVDVSWSPALAVQRDLEMAA